MVNTKRTRFFLTILFMLILSCFCLFIINGCTDDDDDDDDNNNDDTASYFPPDNTAEDQLMDDTFRIDLKTITVTYDLDPIEYTVDAYAVVTFEMRSNQTRAVIHFDPAVRNAEVINEMKLNDEVLDFSDENDVLILSYDETSQRAIELQRDLAADTEHTLIVDYQLQIPEQYGIPLFFTDCNDIAGSGNEEIFPTINVPQELAHHILTFRVQNEMDFSIIGSGYVQQTADGEIQEWVLDTEREIASYTLFCILIPTEYIEYTEETINDVTVRMMAEVGGNELFTTAVEYLEDWLPELETNLGPYPMPRGLSLFLTPSGGGMEYYGATITSLWALNHEVFHMYFGCSTVAKTYRDSWWDEAINMWYEYSVDPNYPPIDDNYRSNMVSGRSPIAVGFDTRAYDEGAHIIQAVAVEVGGRDQMIAFLKYVHENYTFAPFNTIDFLYYLYQNNQVDMYEEFQQWLYSDEDTTNTFDTSAEAWRKKIELKPAREQVIH